jgi:hypothetical protein
MRGIVSAIGVAVLAVCAAGCFGGSGTARPSRPARPQTRVVVEASVGLPARRPAAVTARCPALARCRPQRVPGVRPRQWVLVATRALTCDPTAGDYPYPGAACRALRDLARLEAHPTGVACGCIMPISRPSVIVGRLDGKRFSLTLGACALCGLPAHAGADASILFPA